MKKKISVFIMILCLVLCTASCGSKDETAKYQVYYLDMDETSILGVDYEITASEDNPSEVVDELIAAMKREESDGSDSIFVTEEELPLID